MFTLNQINLIGSIGKDAEVKKFGTRVVAEFSLATSESYKKDDEWKEVTQWHSVKFWASEKMEKWAGDNLKKGAQVFVIGKLTYETYEKGGEKRTKAVVSASEVKIVRKAKEPANEPDWL